MSTIQVANIQFESTGTNRIDFPPGGNTINFRSTNLSFNASSFLFNGVPLSTGGGGASVFSANVGNNSANTFTITHGLNKSFVIPAVRETATGYYVYPDIRFATANSIILEFVDPPATNAYVVIVLG